MESLVTLFTDTLGQHMSRELVVFIVSLFPILELRGGMLAATFLDVPVVKAVILSAIGNFIPIPFILLFIKRILKWMKRFKIFRPLVEKIEKRAENKKGSIENAEFWGLVLFVGVPLPVTGAWTGSLVAAFLDIDIKKAILAELLGIAMAAVIMTIISYGIIGNIIR